MLINIIGSQDAAAAYPGPGHAGSAVGPVYAGWSVRGVTPTVTVTAGWVPLLPAGAAYPGSIETVSAKVPCSCCLALDPHEPWPWGTSIGPGAPTQALFSCLPAHLLPLASPPAIAISPPTTTASPHPGHSVWESGMLSETALSGFACIWRVMSNLKEFSHLLQLRTGLGWPFPRSLKPHIKNKCSENMCSETHSYHLS